MKIDYSKRFIKQLRKSPKHVQLAFAERLELFIGDRSHALLHNHTLHGTLSGYRSINITGDWRAIYAELENGSVLFFEMLGTHSELYG